MRAWLAAIGAVLVGAGGWAIGGFGGRNGKSDLLESEPSGPPDKSGLTTHPEIPVVQDPERALSELSELSGPERSRRFQQQLKGIKSHRQAADWLKVFPRIEQLFGEGAKEVRAAVFAISCHHEDARTAMELASDHLDGERLMGLSSVIVDLASNRDDGVVPADLHLLLNPGKIRTKVIEKMAASFSSKSPEMVVSWLNELPFADEQRLASAQVQAQLQHQITQEGDATSYSALASLLESPAYARRYPSEAQVIVRALKSARPAQELEDWANSFSNADVRAQVAKEISKE